MRLRKLTTLGLAFPLLMACTRGGDTARDQRTSSSPTASTIARSGEDIDSIHESRAAYLNNVEEQLKKKQAQIDELRARRNAQPADSQAFVDLDSRIDDLERRLSGARQELQNLKQATTASWQANKPKLDTVMAELDEPVAAAPAE